MSGAGTRIAAATRAGVAFAGEAWRDAWAAQALLTVGVATVFAAGRLDIPNILAGRLQLGGAVLAAAALLPTLGALYRSAVGGPALKEIGPGGLQAGEVERRTLGVLVLAAAGSAAGLAALLMTGALAWAPLRDFGVLRLPLIGPFGLWFVAALPVLLLVSWVVLVGLSRLLLLLPAAAGEVRWQPRRAFDGSQRWKGGLAATTALCDLIPIALLLGAGNLIGLLERGQPGAFGASVWPAADAVGAALVLSALWAFVALPLGAGARTSFYGRLLAEHRARSRAAALAEVGSEPVAPAAERRDEEPAAAEEPSSRADAVEPEESRARDEVAAEQTAAPAFAEAAEEERAAPDDAPQIALEPHPPAAAGPDASVAESSSGEPSPAVRWRPPVSPVRAAALATAVTTPVLLAHANDRDAAPPWWMPPEHPEGPTVA